MNLQSWTFSCRVILGFYVIKTAINFDFFLLQPCNASSSPQTQISKQRRNAANKLCSRTERWSKQHKKGRLLATLQSAYGLYSWRTMTRTAKYTIFSLYSILQIHVEPCLNRRHQVLSRYLRENIAGPWTLNHCTSRKKNLSVLLTHRPWGKQALGVSILKYNNSRDLPVTFNTSQFC